MREVEKGCFGRWFSAGSSEQPCCMEMAAPGQEVPVTERQGPACTDAHICLRPSAQRVWLALHHGREWNQMVWAQIPVPPLIFLFLEALGFLAMPQSPCLINRIIPERLTSTEWA